MPRLPGRTGLVLAVLATTLSVTWAGTGVLAFFSDSATVGANTFTTAATFGCSAPGSSTLTASEDSWVDQTSVNQNKGTDNRLYVTSESGSKNRRSLLRFTLPALPGGCTVTASTLRLYNESPTLGRVIGVYQGDPAQVTPWTENGVTWANQPGTAGTVAISTTVASAGWQTWTVTAHVQAHYAGPNNGFVVRDQIESFASRQEQRYVSREGSQDPELVVTWG